MRQSNRKFQVRDTVLLTGWLFADLLLGLMVIFFAAIPGAPPRLIELTATPNNLDMAHCTGGFSHLQCTVQLAETRRSQGAVNWTASSDINNTLTFSPAKGILLPGQSVKIAISAIPCQNGSFIFRGSGNASPMIVLWHCTPKPERLEQTYCRLVLNDQNPDKFSDTNNPKFAISVLEPQINALKFLKGRQVGIAIASGGVDDINSGNDRDRGVSIAKNIYNVLRDLANQGPIFKTTSYYEPLFTGFFPAKDAIIDIYLVIRQDNPNDTCGPKYHNPI